MNREHLDHCREWLSTARACLHRIETTDLDLARFILDAERKVLDCLSIVTSRESQLKIEEAKQREADERTAEQTASA